MPRIARISAKSKSFLVVASDFSLSEDLEMIPIIDNVGVRGRSYYFDAASACNSKPSAEITFKIVSKLGVLSPESVL
jgi:hypothetical protein